MLIDFRTLFPKYNIKPKGVLHIGANVGEEAPVYLELGIKKQIWIEANPVIFLKLKENIASNPDAYALNHCISDTDLQDVIFHVSNNGSQSSSILELGTHASVHPDVHYVRHIPMKTTTISAALYAFQYQGKQWSDYDFLNIDLQGNELRALKGMKHMLRETIKWAYLEVNQNELYKGCALVDDIDYFLAEYGFKRVETLWAGNTGWGDALYVKDEIMHHPV